MAAHGGLSPRGRGNPARDDAGDIGRGAIPARAGEPTDTLRRDLHLTAISARAGEPAPTWCAGPTARGYPRAGGGTFEVLYKAEIVEGLSPRGRGNLVRGRHRPEDRGAIPARAGEPVTPVLKMWGKGGYPRAGGGTRRSARHWIRLGGLSPRGRGNHRGNIALVVLIGAIPARAGEPTARRGGKRSDGGYPRAGGGTRWRMILQASVRGLSPRGRGNRRGS